MNWWAFREWLPLAAYLVTLVLYVRRLRTERHVKILVAVALAVAFFKLNICEWMGMSLLSPDLPEIVNWIWSWFFAGAMVHFALSCVLFVRFPWWGVVLPVLALVVAGRGLWNGVRVPDVREVEVVYADLPPALDGYRIVQITDLHSSSAARRWRTEAVVAAANAQKPDLVCLTGDVADGAVERQGPCVEPLRDLRARDGVLACTGNHEYFFGFLEWKGFLERLGIVFLENACVSPRAGLVVGGVPDPHGVDHELDEGPNVVRAFASATNGEFRVLLQHQPKGAEENVRTAGVSLQLSGHVHGGIMPGMRQLLELNNGGFSRGEYRFGKSVLYVSPGCGQCEWMPVRLFNPSEITLVVLRREKGREHEGS